LSYLTLNNIVTLKSGLAVTQCHSNFKLATFESLGVVSYSPSNYGFILHHFRDRDIGHKS